MSTLEIDTSYEPFSREPEYIGGNREFLAELPLAKMRTVLDLACGTGAISELIFEQAPDLNIIGLDLSRESLALGQSDFLESGLQHNGGPVMSAARNGATSRLLLLEGTADCLPLRDAWADLVFMGHSIHMLPDLDRLLGEIRRMLRPDGLFAFNSSFYAGSQAPGTDHFYQHWWKMSLKWILQKDADLKKQGRPGIKRKRGTSGRAFSSPWLSDEEWRESLSTNGFEIVKIHERTIMMSQRAFETIGAYSGFARLMVSGYPIALASEALVKSVAPAMKAAEMTEVPRLWLEVTARRAD